jgi:hypothetical protein
MRITSRLTRGVGQTDTPDSLYDGFLALSAALPMVLQGMFHLVADSQQRMKTGQRILSNQSDPLASERSYVLFASGEKIDPVEFELSRRDLAR